MLFKVPTMNQAGKIQDAWSANWCLETLATGTTLAPTQGVTGDPQLKVVLATCTEALTSKLQTYGGRRRTATATKDTATAGVWTPRHVGLYLNSKETATITTTTKSAGTATVLKMADSNYYWRPLMGDKWLGVKGSTDTAGKTTFAVSLVVDGEKGYFGGWTLTGTGLGTYYFESQGYPGKYLKAVKTARRLSTGRRLASTLSIGTEKGEPGTFWEVIAPAGTTSTADKPCRECAIKVAGSSPHEYLGVSGTGLLEITATESEDVKWHAAAAPATMPAPTLAPKTDIVANTQKYYILDKEKKLQVCITDHTNGVVHLKGKELGLANCQFLMKPESTNTKYSLSQTKDSTEYMLIFNQREGKHEIVAETETDGIDPKIWTLKEDTHFPGHVYLETPVETVTKYMSRTDPAQSGDMMSESADTTSSGTQWHLEKVV
jgi:hypothetical protein